MFKLDFHKLWLVNNGIDISKYFLNKIEIGMRFRTFRRGYLGDDGEFNMTNNFSYIIGYYRCTHTSVAAWD